MKQYEKILVPCSESEATHWVDGTLYRLEIDKIVISAEELREVWEAAEKRILSGPVNRNYKGEFLSNNPDFHEFCESKGIKI